MRSLAKIESSENAQCSADDATAEPVDLISLFAARDRTELFQALDAYFTRYGIECSVFLCQYQGKSRELKTRYQFSKITSDIECCLNTRGLIPALYNERKTSNVVSSVDHDDFSFIPLSGNADQYGFLTTDAKLTESHKQQVENLCRPLGHLLEKLDLLELYAQQHMKDSIKLAGFNRIKSVVKELELEPVLVELTNLALSVVSGNAAALQLPDANGKLSICVELGIGEEQLESIVHRDHRTITRYVHDNNLVWMTDTNEELAEFEQNDFFRTLTAFIVLPLQTKNGVGVLTIVDPEFTTACHIETLLTLNKLSCLCIDNSMLHNEVVEQTIHGEQLKIAGEIQMNLMPLSSPEISNFDVHGINLPADETSGDYFDFISLDEQKFAFVLGDATGHGIGAALIATTARAMLRTLLMNNAPAELNNILSKLNTLLYDDLPDDKFLTLFVGVLDIKLGTLEYLNAGHEPRPIVFNSMDKFTNELGVHGLPLGMFEHTEYDQSSELTLEPHSILLLSSDGIPEAHNPAGEFFGKERILSHLEKNYQQSADKIAISLTHEVKAFSKTEMQNDDITLVVIKGRSID